MQGNPLNRDSIRPKVFGRGGRTSRIGRFGEGRGNRGGTPPSPEKFSPSPIKTLEPYRVADHATEAGEEILAVDGAGAGLGVVLHGEDGLGLVGKTFQRAVVQVYVRDDHIGNVVDIHTETVVLGRDFHMPGREVFNRVVTAVVAEFQLAGRAAQSVAEKLMGRGRCPPRDSFRRAS